MEARLDEIQRINDKLDTLTYDVQAVYNILSEQRGAKVPDRVTALESKINKIEIEQVREESVEKLVANLSETIEGHSSFIYKVSGALIVINIVFMLLFQFVLDKFFLAGG